jgi:hypothetical protein
MHFIIATLTFAAVWAWAVAHDLAIYYVVAVLIEQLPTPATNGNKFYAYFYNVIQVLAANWKRVGSKT